MFGRSIQMVPDCLLLTHLFSWRAREKERFQCPALMTKQKKRCLCHSPGDRNAYGVTRSCFGKLRPSARERSSTPLACHVPKVDYRAFAKKKSAELVSFSAVFLNMKALVRTSTWARKNAHHDSFLDMSCFRLTLLCEHQRVPSVAKFVAVEHT